MSHKGCKMCQIESVRLSINEHLTSVGEEILCVLEKQSDVDVCWVKLNVRVFVLERLSAVEDFMFSLFQREIETLETLLERQNKLLNVMLQPHIQLHRAEVSPEHEESSPRLVQEEPQPPQIKQEQEEADVSTLILLQRKTSCDIPSEISPEHEMNSSLVQDEPHPRQIKEEQEEADVSTILHRKTRCDALSDVLLIPVCKAVSSEYQERSARLVQEEPEPPQIKDEQAELLQRLEEADGSALQLLAVKSEYNRETDPLASSTSTEHMKTQAVVQNWVASQQTSDDELLSSHHSESDTEDSDDWEDKTQNVGGNKPSQDLNSSKQTLSMMTLTVNKHFGCIICSRSFKRKDDLNSHMRIHTGERPFACAVCGKCFNLQGNLKKHTLIHTEERPFTCTVCGKGYGQMATLKKHTCTHTGEKLTRTHMRVHTARKPITFCCTICGKGFCLNTRLKTHMVIHTGEKPFSCTVCGKSFNLKGNLTKHSRTHTGEKPFLCLVCGKYFSLKQAMNRHMRIHKGEKAL